MIVQTPQMGLTTQTPQMNVTAQTPQMSVTIQILQIGVTAYMMWMLSVLDAIHTSTGKAFVWIRCDLYIR